MLDSSWLRFSGRFRRNTQLIILTYFLLGCFIDTIAVILLTLPVFFPLVTGLGYAPVWFGVLLVLMVEMALITPPIGMNVYIISGLDKGVPVENIFKGIAPFILIMVNSLLWIDLIAARDLNKKNETVFWIRGYTPVSEDEEADGHI
ncbi:conserved hypothetical protein [delta proteobacterium NaphS2]|nr:conserved hypothetical protein [delta proteobacterium NaphS2]